MSAFEVPHASLTANILISNQYGVCMMLSEYDMYPAPTLATCCIYLRTSNLCRLMLKYKGCIKKLTWDA